MGNTGLPPKNLGMGASMWLLLAAVIMAAMLFGSAGTFRYWEAWVYLAILLLISVWMLRQLLKNCPALLERRLKMREKEPAQRWIMRLAWLWFAITYLTAGVDKRFQGSTVPTLVVILAELFVVLGYGVVFRVFRENPYASRIIAVEPGQAVISTGPYAVVRHPMYLGVLLIYLFTPLALGSYWAILPAVFIIPILVARIRNEERVLERDLEGYRDYRQCTRYRLLPGLW